MSITSMTGFATQEVVLEEKSWIWDLKSVNGRSLDVKLRLPDGMESLEGPVRDLIKAQVRRGSLQVSLRRAPRDTGQSPTVQADLKVLFEQVDLIKSAADRAGITVMPLTMSEILEGKLNGKSLFAPRRSDRDMAMSLLPGFESALSDLVASRQSEGKAMLRILTSLIGRISVLVDQARRVDRQRAVARKDNLAAAVRRVMSLETEIDPGRLEQELALIAVKADVAEELDRLDAHVLTARGFLAEDKPVGRRLEFLTQEFNREANTLCSKAQFTELTRVGLDLKSAIDQLREQSLNVE